MGGEGTACAVRLLLLRYLLLRRGVDGRDTPDAYQDTGLVAQGRLPLVMAGTRPAMAEEQRAGRQSPSPGSLDPDTQKPTRGHDAQAAGTGGSADPRQL